MSPSLLPVPRAGFVTSEHVCFFRGDSRTTAELIAAKVLWTAGYKVPQTFVVQFSPSRLMLSSQTVTRGK